MDSDRFIARAHATSLAARDQINAQGAPTFFASEWGDAGGVRVHHVSSGEGPVILFIHGFPSFWYCWARQLEALRYKYRVIAIDAPGAGASASAGAIEAYRVSALATQMRQLIQNVAPDQKVLLVGHDWGAALAFAVAQAFPAQVAGVVGIAGLPFNQILTLLANDEDQQRRSHYMERLCALSLEQAELTAWTIVASAYAELGPCGALDAGEMALFERACGDPRAFWNGSLWYRANLPDAQRLPKDCMWPPADPALDVPSLLVWGEADEVFVPQAPEQFTARHPFSTVVRLEGVGHWCMLQAPEKVNLALLEFADRCFGAPSAPRQA